MAGADNRSIMLGPDDEAFVQTLIDTGAYGSRSEVVGAGLRRLRDDAAIIEDWLTNEVAPAYDAMVAHPELGRSVAEVFAAIRTQHGASKTDA